jgi:SAM-dependent methyltransferase
MDASFWDDKFIQNPGLYGDAPNEFFQEQIQALPPGSILLPGEGEGRNALFAASKDWKVIAIDQSPIARKRSLEKAQEAGIHIEYQVCSIQEFSHFPESFDAIALIYFHLPQNIMKQVHTKFTKMLKKDGVLIIEGFGKNQLNFTSGGPKNIAMLYEMETLKSSFPGIKWEFELEDTIFLNEGLGHKGHAHLIRLVGKKIGE